MCPNKKKISIPNSGGVRWLGARIRQNPLGPLDIIKAPSIFAHVRPRRCVRCWVLVAVVGGGRYHKKQPAVLRCKSGARDVNRRAYFATRVSKCSSPSPPPRSACTTYVVMQEIPKKLQQNVSASALSTPSTPPPPPSFQLHTIAAFLHPSICSYIFRFSFFKQIACTFCSTATA